MNTDNSSHHHHQQPTNQLLLWQDVAAKCFAAPQKNTRCLSANCFKLRDDVQKLSQDHAKLMQLHGNLAVFQQVNVIFAYVCLPSSTSSF